jgi:hypothetical protein
MIVTYDRNSFIIQATGSRKWQLIFPSFISPKSSFIESVGHFFLQKSFKAVFGKTLALGFAVIIENQRKINEI